MKIALLIFFILFACSKKKSFNVDNFNFKNNEKLTFIFDFDSTVYNDSWGNNYGAKLYKNAFKRNDISKFLAFIFLFQNRDYIEENMEKLRALIIRMQDKFNVKIDHIDIAITLLQLQNLRTPGLGEIIKEIKSKGHQVIVIGGGQWGCAIIPKMMENFGVDKSDIYSGYFKDFSDDEMNEALFTRYRYVNCADLDFKTPFTDKKSSIIKFLRNKKMVTGKVIHIGDALNDLEVWETKSADLFIGFGVNKINKKVQTDSPVFVKNMDEFKSLIEQLINVK